MSISLLHQKLKLLSTDHLKNIQAALTTIEYYQKILDSYGIDNDLIQDFGGVQYVREDVSYLLNKTVNKHATHQST